MLPKPEAPTVSFAPSQPRPKATPAPIASDLPSGALAGAAEAAEAASKQGSVVQEPQGLQVSLTAINTSKVASCHQRSHAVSGLLAQCSLLLERRFVCWRYETIGTQKQGRERKNGLLTELGAAVVLLAMCGSSALPIVSSRTVLMGLVSPRHLVQRSAVQQHGTNSCWGRLGK